MSVVDHPSFRAAFGSTIPSGLDRKALQHEIVSKAVEVKGEVLQNLQNKDVSLLLDGGTLANILMQKRIKPTESDI